MKKITLLLFSFLAIQIGNAQGTCATAISVGEGITNVGAINGTSNNTCGWPTAASAGNWYSYTATQDGVVIITSNLPQNDGITNSDDTRLSILTGTCASLICLTGNDDINNSNYLSEVGFAVEPGTTYYILWDNRWAPEGFDFELSFEAVTCPDGSLPFSEDFSNPNNFLVCWDNIDADGDGQSWAVIDYDLNEDGVPDGNPTLASASWTSATGALTPDNWAISSAIDLSSLPSDAEIALTWEARGVDVDFADENYTVYVGNNNEISSLVNSSVTFNEIIGQNGGAGVFVPRQLDISSLRGETVYVAFRHHNSTDEFVLNIDTIEIAFTLSTADFLNNNVTHYFDKSTESLHIESSQLSFNAIEIFNILGQSALQKPLSSNIEIIDLNSIANGVYLAKIEVEGGTKTIKFVKQ